MPDINGSCLCGAVRYSTTAEPIFSGVCHCRNCQKGGGSAFGVVMAVPDASLSVTGVLTTFQSKGDSGGTLHRRFCPTCGSPVTSGAAVMPGIVMISVGTLDDPSWLTPAVQIYCDSAQPWVNLSGGITAFPKMPPPF
jgi:hypothetical protein